jgi:hypothetical protein
MGQFCAEHEQTTTLATALRAAAADAASSPRRDGTFVHDRQAMGEVVSHV